jgi:tRNA(Ile)-lysidine synthase
MSPLIPVDPSIIIPWPDLAKPLQLPDGRILVCEPVEQNPALSALLLSQGKVTIRYRQGGERLQPANSAHHKSLKQIFQEQRIPHWQRDRVPLVYLNEELMAAVGVCLERAAVRLFADDVFMIEFGS